MEERTKPTSVRRRQMHLIFNVDKWSTLTNEAGGGVPASSALVARFVADPDKYVAAALAAGSCDECRRRVVTFADGETKNAFLGARRVANLALDVTIEPPTASAVWNALVNERYQEILDHVPF